MLFPIGLFGKKTMFPKNGYYISSIEKFISTRKLNDKQATRYRQAMKPDDQHVVYCSGTEYGNYIFNPLQDGGRWQRLKISITAKEAESFYDYRMENPTKVEIK